VAALVCGSVSSFSPRRSLAIRGSISAEHYLPMSQICLIRAGTIQCSALGFWTRQGRPMWALWRNAPTHSGAACPGRTAKPCHIARIWAGALGLRLSYGAGLELNGRRAARCTGHTAAGDLVKTLLSNHQLSLGLHRFDILHEVHPVPSIAEDRGRDRRKRSGKSMTALAAMPVLPKATLRAAISCWRQDR